MKSFMKLFGIILLSISLLLSVSFYPPVFAEETQSILLSGEEGLLQYLGITIDGLDYGKILTRGELAYMAAKTANAKNQKQEQIFYDVAESHPYYDEISALAQMGVIHGVAEGYFEPGEPASYEAAYKIFSTILGYKLVDDFWNWHKIAKYTGINDGIEERGALTYGKVLRMAHNALHCEMMEGILYGDGVTYKTTSNYFAIERYHGLVMERGIVDGVPGTTLDHPDMLLEGNGIMIDGTVHEYERGKDFFGMTVIFYAKRDSVTKKSEKKIAYLYADENRNSVLSVDANDVIGKEDEYFKYFVNEKEKAVKITRETDVIINGVAYPDYTNADLKPSVGTLVLIDNNNDAIYDVIHIESYTYAVVKGVDVERKMIHGKYPEVSFGDLNRDVSFEVLNADGKLIYPKNLKDGSVVAVKISPNKTGTIKFIAEVIENGYSGKVEAITDKTITINGREFMLSHGMVCDDEILLGDYVMVYVHREQCAVILHPENASDTIAFMIDAKATGNAFSKNLMIRVVENNKEIKEFTGAKKVVVDGVSCKDADVVLTLLQNSASETYKTEGWRYSQLIRYRLNNEGMLTHIDTGTYNPLAETEDSLQRMQSGSKYEYLRYNTTNRSFYEVETVDGKEKIKSFKYSVRNSVQAIWSVPSLNRDEPEWYSTWLGNGLYWVEPYNVDPDSMVAEYLVAYCTKMTNVADAADPYIVTDVETLLGDEGMVVKRIKATGYDKIPVECYLTDELVETDVRIGDVVQWRQNYKDSSLQAIKVVFRAGDIPDENERYITTGDAGTSAYSIQLRMAYGTVKAIKDNFISHTTSLVDDANGVTSVNLNNYMVNSTKFYLYDMTETNPVIKTATKEDVMTYSVSKTNPDHVVVCEQYGVLKFVYIIKK